RGTREVVRSVQRQLRDGVITYATVIEYLAPEHCGGVLAIRRQRDAAALTAVVGHLAIDDEAGTGVLRQRVVQRSTDVVAAFSLGSDQVTLVEPGQVQHTGRRTRETDEAVTGQQTVVIDGAHGAEAGAAVERTRKADVAAVGFGIASRPGD